MLEKRRLRRLDVTAKEREGTQSRLSAIERVRGLQFFVTPEGRRGTDALSEGMRLDRRKDFLCATGENQRERWGLRAESSLEDEGPHLSELGGPSCPRGEGRQQSPLGVNLVY